MKCSARSQDLQDQRLRDLGPGLLRFYRIARAVEVENNHSAFTGKTKTKTLGKGPRDMPTCRTEPLDYWVL